MDISRAREIIEALSDGINPITGEYLPQDHCFNEPDVIRALYVATEQLKNAEKRNSRNLPENAGKPWNAKDDEELAEMFNEGKTRKEICTYFQRTTGSIAARLFRLGLIQTVEEFKYKP